MKVPCAISKSVSGALSSASDLQDCAGSFGVLFDAVNEGLLVFDNDSLCIAANRSACLLFDCPMNELTGQSLVTLMGVHRRNLSHAELAVELARESSPQWLGARIAAEDESHFIVACRDATRERRLEEQLLHSQRLQLIGQLTSGILHDVNNMATVIRTCAELLQRGLPAGSPLTRYSQNMVAAVDRSTQITRQLLGISRRNPADVQTLQLHDAISEMTPLLHRLVAEQIVIEVCVDPAVSSVKADPTQLAQVLLNLVINARDAMPNGGSIFIRAADFIVHGPSLPDNMLAPGTYVLLEVRDTGVGMTPEVQARIFDPFFTTKKNGKGSGLGLATVRTIVQAAGGNILVESQPGRGTSVQIYFPAWEPSRPVPARKSGYPRPASVRFQRSVQWALPCPPGTGSD